MDKMKVIDKAREELRKILLKDWDYYLVTGGIDLYSYDEENHTQTVILVFSMNTDTKYEFTFYNGKLLELMAVELKWKKTYA